MGTSHNPLYPLKAKSHIWEGSFREKTKSFQKQSKIKKLTFPRHFLYVKIGRIRYAGEPPTTRSTY